MSNSMTKAERLELLKMAHIKAVKRQQVREREIERWMPTSDFIGTFDGYESEPKVILYGATLRVID